MSKFKNTVAITGLLTPHDSDDDYAVTDPTWGIDGWRTCADEAEMFAIKKPRRRKGMIVAIPALDDNDQPILNQNGYQEFFVYQLVNNPSSGPTTIDDWQQLDFGSGDDKHYTHTQAIPSNEWIVTHNLNKKVAVVVEVTDYPGVFAIPGVEYINNNVVKIYVDQNPRMGYAYCN